MVKFKIKFVNFFVKLKFFCKIDINTFIFNVKILIINIILIQTDEEEKTKLNYKLNKGITSI